MPSSISIDKGAGATGIVEKAEREALSNLAAVLIGDHDQATDAPVGETGTAA
jgi:hypothetical protein